MTKTYDLHILREIPLVSPSRLKRTIPMTDAATGTVVDSRKAINAVIARENDRLLLISGPCSIHDYGAALEYAHLLKDRLHVIVDSSRRNL